VEKNLEHGADNMTEFL